MVFKQLFDVPLGDLAVQHEFRPVLMAAAAHIIAFGIFACTQQAVKYGAHAQQPVDFVHGQDMRRQDMRDRAAHREEMKAVETLQPTTKLKVIGFPWAACWTLTWLNSYMPDTQDICSWSARSLRTSCAMPPWRIRNMRHPGRAKMGRGIRITACHTNQASMSQQGVSLWAHLRQQAHDGAGACMHRIHIARTVDAAAAARMNRGCASSMPPGSDPSGQPSRQGVISQD
jgi:hypothetical protein